MKTVANDTVLANSPDISSLSTQEVQFLNNYIANGNNGTEAMLQLKPDYTRGSAGVRASQVLSKPKAQEYLQQFKDNLIHKTQLTKQDLIEYASYGLEQCKADREFGTMYKGIEVSAKLIGAFETDMDDLTKYTGLLSRICAENVQININTTVKEP